MIPKKIHYCWFGGNPLPELAQRCIASWKVYFPDYEIIEWNESNFDFMACNYSAEAYKEKKWAFISDYARYKILYEHGGVYFDTDVEVIKSFDEILEKGAFMGCENSDLKMGVKVASGLGCAAEAGNMFYKKMLEDYEKSSFYNEDGTVNLYTVVERTTKLLQEDGLKDTMDIQTVENITIYPAEYFCPKDVRTRLLNVTEKTFSIHHFDGSWLSADEQLCAKYYAKLCRVLPNKISWYVSKGLSLYKIKGFWGAASYIFRFIIKKFS